MSILFEEFFDSSIPCLQYQWTKDTLSDLPTCRGVLLFTNACGKPIQLLQAAGLRRTAQAKLLRETSEPASRKADVSDVTTAIYYTCCYNSYLSQITYTHLAHAIFANQAGNWIQLPNVSLAAIDPDSFLPFYYVSDANAEQKMQTRFGLFPTRKAALEFCEILNTVFTLCHNSRLLKSGKEQSCTYLQMQTCPGPCLNADLRQSYADAVKLSLQVTFGNVELVEQQFRQQMHQASEQMAFEQAQQCKKKLDLLKKLARPDFGHVHPLENLCFLHIDTGPKVKIEGSNRKIQQLMWFKITAEQSYHLGNCTPETEDEIKCFLETNWSKDDAPLPVQSPAEHLRILSLYLFRSNRPGIWIDCTNGIWLDKITFALNQNKPR